MNNHASVDLNDKVNGSGTSGKSRSRKPLVLILVVSVLPVFAAYFIFFTGWGMPENTVNKGQFIEPVSLQPLVTEDEWARFQEDKKWRLVVPVNSPCEEACQQNLYTTRQVHIRLDQRSKRVERLAYFSEGISETEKGRILEAHPQLKVLSARNAESWFGSLSLPESIATDYYLLVDQEGMAMMAYDGNQHGNEVLKDLKRAIKFSIDYQ